jgi:putative transposase
MAYVHTRSSWLYLAVVLDLLSRKVVGWAIALSMPAELVCAALSMAVVSRQPLPGLLVIQTKAVKAESTGRRNTFNRRGFYGET